MGRPKIHPLPSELLGDEDIFTTTVKIPNKLAKEWRARKVALGKELNLSELTTTALQFSLFGPHQFVNPIDGLIDAFQFYEEHRKFEADMAAALIKKIAQAYGIGLTIED